MRTLPLLLLLGVAGSPVRAAPVPKELRTPSIVGTWTLTGANVKGAEHPDYHGQRWTFGGDGSFANPAYPSGSYAVRAGGVDLKFTRTQPTAMALAGFDGATLRLAFSGDENKRAADFIGANNSVVYTFERAKE